MKHTPHKPLLRASVWQQSLFETTPSFESLAGSPFLTYTHTGVSLHVCQGRLTPHNLAKYTKKTVFVSRDWQNNQNISALTTPPKSLLAKTEHFRQTYFVITWFRTIGKEITFSILDSISKGLMSIKCTLSLTCLNRTYPEAFDMLFFIWLVIYMDLSYVC